MRKLFPAALVTSLARACGAVQRMRKVDPVELFWTVVLGFGVGRERTLAGLRRAYQKSTGQQIEESSFYDRFTPGFAAMLKRAVTMALDEALGVGRGLRGPLAAFRDVILTDSTVVRLHELLAGAFPACRTNHTKAALKAHVVLSVRGEGDQSIKVTAERAHDGPIFRVGKWVKDRLLLFDLGYFRYQLFACITRNGGWFLSRLKANANPTIVAVNRRHRGRAVGLVGAKLRDVVQRLQREVLDVMVEVRFEHRRYAGRTSRATQRLRVVGVRDAGSGEYHLYVTNIPPEKLAAEDVSATYALRWQIELLFKELKRHYRLEDMPSAKRAVVEALLYAAILTLIVSRRLEALVRESLGALGERVPHQRWAAVLESVAQDLLVIIVRPPRETAQLLTRVARTLLHEAVDPNRRRPPLLIVVETRAHRYRTAEA
ncbi:MAG: IS4 family transposase [Deltaproteobacteria bacterium]|nr:IS4 family transposase [Deltaproteobacteria bacterium]